MKPCTELLQALLAAAILSIPLALDIVLRP